MKAAFKKDVLHCDKCGGTKQVIAAIPPGAIASKILRHLGLPFSAHQKKPPNWRQNRPCKTICARKLPAFARANSARNLLICG